MTFIGIDFGTTNSTLAVCDADGEVRLTEYSAAGQRYDTFRSVLYEVSPADPLTLIGVSLVLLTTALLACTIPARRAMRVDPVTVMRL